MILTVDTERLNRELILQGLTQLSVAAELKMSRQAISKIFTGKSSHPPTIKKVAQALGLETSDIWIDSDGNAA